MPQVDYDALARQYGGTPADEAPAGDVDYDALAAQFGGQAADATPAAQPAQADAVSRFLSNAGEVLNPVTAITGLASAVRHPIRTGQGIVQAHVAQAGKARQAFTEGRMSEAVGHAGATLLPILGPAAADIGEQIGTGDVAGGLGRGVATVAGTALAGPAVRGAGRMAKPVADRVSRGLYQSALKPTKAVLKDVRVPKGAEPDAARRILVETALKERIPISPAGAKKVDTLMESLNAQVTAKLDEASAQGKTIDPTYVDEQIAAVAKDFTDQINAQPDLAAIGTVRQNFTTNPKVEQPIYPVEGEATALQRHLRAGGSPQSFRPPVPDRAPGPIPIKTAQAMKVNTYKGLRGKYGTERGATIEAEKAGARGLKEQIDIQAPEVAADNARMGSLIPLEEAIADAMRRRGNYDVFGLTPMVASIPAVTHGNLWPILAAMLDRSQRLKSHAAIAVHRAGTRAGRATGRVTHGAARATTATNAARVPMRVPATAEEDRARRRRAQGPR